MFLVSDGLVGAESKIRKLSAHEPSIGLVVAAVFFEWTLSRAIICLGHSTNEQLRKKIKDSYGLERYKELWVEEIDGKCLPQVVKSWSNLRSAFGARNVLIHGRDRYTQKIATPDFDAFLAA